MENLMITNGGTTEATNPKITASWNSQTVDIFCDLCINEVERGQRPGTHLSKEGWDSLIKKFNQQTGNNYNKSKLKNKWDTLKKEWKDWKDLKGRETGLGWNPTKGTVDASDEWWENKIQINARFAKFRGKGMNPEMEAKLDMMFHGVVATGRYAWAPSSDTLPPQNGGSSGDDVNSVENGDDSDEISLIDISQATQNTPEIPKKRKKDENDTYTSKGKKVQGCEGGKKLKGAARMYQQIDRLIQSVENRNTTSSAFLKSIQSISIAEAMKEVKGLPGIEHGGPLWWFASELFCSKEKREVFCAMEDPEMKLQFLIRNHENAK